MNTKTTTAIAILAIGILAAPALKATSFTANTGDILLGFRQTGNNTSDYVIDLTKLNAAWTTAGLRDASSPLVLNLGAALSTDFTTAFGSASPSGLLWGFIANSSSFSGDTFRTFYLSEPFGGSPLNTSAQSTQITAINGLLGQYGPLTTGAITGGTILTDATNGLSLYQNSWTSRVTSSFDNAQLASIEDSIANGLDFWKLPQTANGVPSNEGAFTFSGTTLTFTPTPEPGSALMLGMAALGVVGFRRRRTA